MKLVPITLIYLRIAIGIFLLVCSFFPFEGYSVLAVVLVAIGFLSDILDGIIARRLNISTPTLRRLDSAADQVFWVLVSIALYVQCPQFFKINYLQLIILFGAEALTYVVSFIKFKKEVATHAIASKIWVISISATLIQVILTCSSTALFQICFYVGLITRLEIIAILLIIKPWTNDVPSFFHAIKLRKGKAIKRNKLFNG